MCELKCSDVWDLFSFSTTCICSYCALFLFPRKCISLGKMLFFQADCMRLALSISGFSCCKILEGSDGIKMQKLIFLFSLPVLWHLFCIGFLLLLPLRSPIPSVTYNYNGTAICIPVAFFFFPALNAFYSLASGRNCVAYVKRLKLFPLHSFWMAPLYLGLHFRQSRNVIVVDLDPRSLGRHYIAMFESSQNVLLKPTESWREALLNSKVMELFFTVSPCPLTPARRVPWECQLLYFS